MKKRSFLILAFLLFVPFLVLAESRDYALSLLSEPAIAGSSRYIGMGGAMAAVGGDVSAAKDNPAAIGIFRRSEISVSTNISGQRCKSDATYKVALVSVPSVSWLFHFGNKMLGSGVLDQSLAFSYGRVLYGSEDWLRSVQPEYSRQPQHWRTTSELKLDDYSIDYGMNISNCLYLGAGVSLRSYRVGVLSDEGDSIFDDYALAGLGVNLRAGIIYRPLTWLRLGCAVHSPTWASNTGRMPMRTVAGMAFQFLSSGLLSVEYDYQHDGTHHLEDRHMIKAGAEYVFLNNGFLDVGYAYSFIDDRHHASLGLSWRSAHIVAGVAYLFGRTAKPLVIGAFPLTEDNILKYSHNVVFTLAFRY